MYIYYIYTHTFLKNSFYCELHGTAHKINTQLNELLHTHTNTTQVKKENIACTLMFMRFIYVVTHSCSLFIFITMWHSSICIHHNLSILLLMNISLQFLPMNILVHVSWTRECIDKSEIVGS